MWYATAVRGPRRSIGADDVCRFIEPAAYGDLDRQQLSAVPYAQIGPVLQKDRGDAGAVSRDGPVQWRPPAVARQRLQVHPGTGLPRMFAT